MGISNAISGGIMLMVLLIISAIIGTSIVDANDTLNRASSDRSNLENEILKTSVMIYSVQTNSTGSYATVILNNTGTTKLYNYARFNVIVRYDSGGSKVTENLNYAGVTSTPPNGWWSITQFIGDLMDPQILNPGEQIQLKCKLSNPLSSGGKMSVIISTDNGIVATKSAVIT